MQVSFVIVTSRSSRQARRVLRRRSSKRPGAPPVTARCGGFCSSSKGGALGNPLPAAPLEQGACQRGNALSRNENYCFLWNFPVRFPVFQSRHGSAACPKADRPRQTCLASCTDELTATVRYAPTGDSGIVSRSPTRFPRAAAQLPHAELPQQKRQAARYKWGRDETKQHVNIIGLRPVDLLAN